jgi:UDP-glucose 4-epimerase
VDACAGEPRVAVVGANGFIGRRLTAALHHRGAGVAGYTRRNELCWREEPAVPEIVFYLASSITPALAEQHPEYARKDHHGFADLLRRLSRSPRPPTVVLTSSGGTVYDPALTGPCTEDAPTRASSRYGAAKLALERLLLDHADTVPSVILRLSNVYGPSQRVGKGQGVLAYWLAAALHGNPLQVIGDPATTRDYVYVDDVVDCMLRVASRSPALTATGPVVMNVASGASTALGELLSVVRAVVGHDLDVQCRPGRAVDRRDSHLDVRRAAQVLGWRAHTPLIDGVAAMWDALVTGDQRTSIPAGLPVATLA